MLDLVIHGGTVVTPSGVGQFDRSVLHCGAGCFTLFATGVF